MDLTKEIRVDNTHTQNFNNEMVVSLKNKTIREANNHEL